MESKNLIEIAFDMMDLDKNGFLDREEILLALGNIEESGFE
jgi:Ca2+-binding EF-hand superfamily protein